jgi:hypothetical protein
MSYSIQLQLISQLNRCEDGIESSTRAHMNKSLVHNVYYDVEGYIFSNVSTVVWSSVARYHPYTNTLKFNDNELLAEIQRNKTRT